MKFKIPFTKKYIEVKNSSLATPTEWLLALLGDSSESKSGIYVSSKKALQVSAVFACIKVISETIASLPLHLYKKTVNGKEKADNLDLYSILHYLPNNRTIQFDFWVMYIVNLLLTGDAFAYIKRDNSGKIRELWNIPSGKVTISKNQKTNELYYKVKDDEGNEVIYYPEQIMHTRGMRFDKADESLDPIALARDALGLSLALEEFGSKYFKNGASVGGIAEYPGALSDEAFERFKNSFYKEYQGVANSNKILFLEQGSKFTKTSNTPEESQSLESRKFQVIEIARFFNVPPHKIFDLDRATFSNIEHQSIEFVQSCISPLCVRLEQTIYKDLLMPRERRTLFAKFSLNGLLRGDINTRKEYYQSGIQNGYLSPNDVRALEDMNKIKNGDIYMINGNMMPLSKIEEVYKSRMATEGGDNNGESDEDDERQDGNKEQN